MHYYLSLTGRCNLSCRYCYGKCCEDRVSEEEMDLYDFFLPSDSEVLVEDLVRLSKEDPDLIITFYGGEPLLMIDKIMKVMDGVSAKEFMIQTNGINLDKLPADYVNKLSTILVSIDGTREHTDFTRGSGTYDKVIENVKLLKANGYEGDIIARMTVDESCDIYENVVYLFENDDFCFDAVHWQLDAQFWSSDYEGRDFRSWSLNEYNSKIDKLIDWWVGKMKNERKVFLIYPFVGILDSLLFGNKSPMRCGAGHSVLGIQTDGVITGCPITAGYKPLYMGDVKSSCLDDLEKRKILPDGQCQLCEIRDVCGGRCLYANRTQLWGKKGFSEVCGTVFFLVECLRKRVPEIKKLIDEGVVSEKDFEYRKYNGCEIIP